MKAFWFRVLQGLRHTLRGEVPIVVCVDCMKPTDTAQNIGGDFGVCSRCLKPTSSRDSLEVWEGTK